MKSIINLLALSAYLVFGLGTLVGCLSDGSIYKKNFLQANNEKTPEGKGFVTVVYQLEHPREKDVRVIWSTVDGTAKSVGRIEEGGQDFRAVKNARSVIPAGETEGRLTVPVNNDAFDEHNEHFKVVLRPEDESLNGEEGNIKETEILVTIVDDDKSPRIILGSDARIDEENGRVTIDYTLTSVSGRETGFIWSTRDASARSEDGDYVEQLRQWKSILPGETGGTLSVLISDDQSDEDDEEFEIILYNSSLSGIGSDGSLLQAKIVIVDNDDPPTITLSDTIINENEGEVLVDYKLSVASGKETRFVWSTVDGTAKAEDKDFQGRSDIMVQIPPNVDQGVLRILVEADEIEEADEAFAVVIDSKSLFEIKESGSKLQSHIVIKDVLDTKRHTDYFRQLPHVQTKDTGNLPVDILWVLDNSGSLRNHQKTLADGFESFVKYFVGQAAIDTGEDTLDFKMGIITTDSARNRVPASSLLDQGNMLDSSDDFIAEFTNRVRVGTWGSPNEKGFWNTDQFFQANQDDPAWIRDDAYLLVIYVSNANDNSSHTVEYWVDKFRSYKSVDSLVKVYSVVDIDPSSRNYSVRYIDASLQTGGVYVNIYGKFDVVLQGIARNIWQLYNVFPLTRKPVKIISVKVEETLMGQNNWHYDESTRSVKFNKGFIPLAGNDIEIYYKYE